VWPEPTPFFAVLRSSLQGRVCRGGRLYISGGIDLCAVGLIFPLGGYSKSLLVAKFVETVHCF
jgi:hypothetical protein